MRAGTTTAAHVYRGIAGLILQDRKIGEDGALDMSDLAFSGLTITGLLGDKILVNGTYDPYIEVHTTLVRFRLLNGANARIFHVGFTDDRTRNRGWGSGSSMCMCTMPWRPDGLLYRTDR